MFHALRLLAVLMAALFSSGSTALAAQTIHDDLVYQAALGEAEDVKALLSEGASPNATNEDGIPAISLAAQRGDAESLEIIKALVGAGANLNVRDNRGETPLMNTIAVRHLEAVHFLISSGSDFYAVNTSGKSVLQQAEWVGDEDIIALVNQAVTLDKDRRAERISGDYMYEKLDEYLYYNCARQYMTYYKASGQDKLDEAQYQRQMEKMDGIIHNAQIELEYNFNMRRDDIERMGKDTRQLIFDEMENLISNRNRRKHGIGKEADLDKRCKKILNMWRESFAERNTAQ